MKRFHAHVRVDDLESSVRFYSTLFGTEPTLLKADYAKWMLDDRRSILRSPRDRLRPVSIILGCRSNRMKTSR